jgi:hypothetical protein
MLKKVLVGSFLVSMTIVPFSMATSEEAPINGTVESKCSIFTETQGVYGTPLASRLSTAPADGGVQPIIRFDVALADAFKGRISYPTSFSSSPSLPDTQAFTGDVEVSTVSDVGMADYDTDKIEFDNTHEYDLTVAGTTRFKVSSQMDYGDTKALPAGNYTALVTAECIAK